MSILSLVKQKYIGIPKRQNLNLNEINMIKFLIIEQDLRISGTSQKNSLTYPFALKLKKIVSGLGLMPSVKLLLQKFTK